ncbi:MAG: PD40 domain-containing protein [Bacteroidales bacterium]|nr:PD40 domain-containing protein [Bacteroidales bacterium]
MSLVATGSIAQNHEKETYKGDYFGQKPPGNTPEIFLPEVFNQFKYLHGKLVFAPDGRQAFWIINTNDNGVEINMRWIIRQDKDGVWMTPEESFLSKERKENGPSFSIDGKRVYYQSRSALNGVGPVKDIDIWYRQKTGEGWGEPINIDKPVNSSDDDSQPWVTADGSIIFCRTNEASAGGDKGGSDIYHSQFMNGYYSEPVCYGPGINSAYHDTEPAMSPEGSYMLFISNRPGGYSRMMNLYVSFRTPEGGWTDARCLSLDFKIDNIWFPTISYDGKYIFFCGGYPTEHGYDSSNYYWVSTEVVNEMNPFKPPAILLQQIVNPTDL